MPGHILVSCLLTVRDVVLIGFKIWNWCFALETLARDDGLREPSEDPVLLSSLTLDCGRSVVRTVQSNTLLFFSPSSLPCI